MLLLLLLFDRDESPIGRALASFIYFAFFGSAAFGVLMILFSYCMGHEFSGGMCFVTGLAWGIPMALFFAPMMAAVEIVRKRSLFCRLFCSISCFLLCLVPVIASLAIIMFIGKPLAQTPLAEFIGITVFPIAAVIFCLEPFIATKIAVERTKNFVSSDSMPKALADLNRSINACVFRKDFDLADKLSRQLVAMAERDFEHCN